MTHWKTSLQALLTVLIALPSALAEFTSLMPRRLALIIAVTSAVGKLVLGQLQKDAGTADAILPGSSVPQSVPAHETPDDPNAVPVKGAKL